MAENQHFRDLPSYAYREQRFPDEFREFVAQRVLPRIEFDGYKLDRQREIATHLIHNLILAGQVHGCVFDSRDSARADARLRAKLWDALIEAGLARKCTGNSYVSKRTLYRASGALLGLFKGWKIDQLIDFNLGRNTTTPEAPSWHALVVLQDKDRNLLPLPPEHLDHQLNGIPLREYLASVEDTIEAINRANLRHAWLAFKVVGLGKRRAFQPCVVLKQKHSGQLLRYARLYTWSALSAQNLSKEERQLIQIDAQPVAELDFSACMLRMAYNIAGHDPDHDSDLYRPEKVLPRFYSYRNASPEKRAAARDFVKRATIILLNVTSRTRAEKAVQKCLSDDPALREIVQTVEETTARGIVRRIEKAHPKIADRFFTEIAAVLQTLDGMIMLRILESFASENRPALGIHDSIVCRRKDVKFARAAMHIAYTSMLGFPPVIRRAF